MDNSENKNVDVAENATQDNAVANEAPVESTNAQSETAQPQAAQASAPLPTFDALNADAPVVTADVIAARLKESAEKRGAAPLADRVRSSRAREARKNESGEDDKPARQPRERREKRDRNDRPQVVVRGPLTSIPTPNRREQLSGDLEDEFNALFGDAENLDAIMAKSSDAVAAAEQIEDGTKVDCRVESIHQDSVFVDIGAREFGLIPLKQFPEDYVLEPGQTFKAVVTKFNSADGVYEVSLPGAAADAGDWLSLTQGAIVECVVTGANTGGLECSVGKLKGFMPFSQIAPFRVDNAEQFVGERWKCIITEINPERRRLVVSRRSLMEKEREELREKTLSELAEGQKREGLVRKIIDQGAFIDLGGVDAFLPISQISWSRIKHPTDAIKEGDRVVVTILRIDPANNRISVSMRDADQDPWRTVEYDLKVGEIRRGRVSSIKEFGAFVEIGPGLEGLVHISEIAYQRVAAVSDVLKVGDFVDVKILSIDLTKKKLSLSIKQTQQDPRVVAKQEAEAKAAADAATAEEEERRKDEEALQAAKERIRKMKPKGPLKGGLGRDDEDNGTGLHF